MVKINQEYETDVWPTVVTSIIELCYVATVTELITLHYLFDYDLEEYFHHRDMTHFDEYISFLLSDPDTYNEYITRLELLNCDGNVLACLIEMPKAVLTDIDEINMYNQEDSFDKLSSVLQEIVKNTLRDLDVLSYLPTKEVMIAMLNAELKDVNVNLRTSKILIE